MKNKRRVFFMGFMQIFQSPLFYLAIIGLCGMCFISVWQYLTGMDGNFKGTNVLYFFEIFIDLTMFKKLVVIFAAIPFAASFCSDWNCQYIKPVVIRSGVRKYTWSKVTICFISAFLTVFVGLIIFILLLSLKMPILPVENIQDSVVAPFAPLATGPLPILYILARVFVFSLAAALWSVVGLAISAYIPNRFVAIASPVIASYLLEELTSYLPGWLNIYYLERSRNVIKEGPAVSFIYFCFIFILLAIISGLIFSRQVRRRVQNEVV